MVTWPRGDEDDPSDGGLSVRSGVDDHEIGVLRWFDSHMGPVPQPGPHVAIRGVPQVGGPVVQIVVAVEQVPALIAALARVSHSTAVAWERDGESYWAGWRGEARGEPMGSGPGRSPLAPQP